MQKEYLCRKKEVNEQKNEDLEYEINQLKRKQKEYLKSAEILKEETCTNADLFSPRNYRLQNREKLEQIHEEIEKIKNELDAKEQQLEKLQGEQAKSLKRSIETENPELGATSSALKSECRRDTESSVGEELLSESELKSVMNVIVADEVGETSKSLSISSCHESEQKMEELVRLENTDSVDREISGLKIQPTIWIQELKDEGKTASVPEVEGTDRTERELLTSEKIENNSDIYDRQWKENQEYDLDEVNRERALATSRIADGLKNLQLRKDASDTIDYQLQRRTDAEPEKTEDNLCSVFSVDNVDSTEKNSTIYSDTSIYKTEEMEVKSEEVIILESERKKEREFLGEIYLKVERSLALLNGNRNVSKKELQQVKRMIYDYVQKIS